MANGIYNDINTKEEYSEMEENRGKMYKIKVWLERTAIVEGISMLYLMFASVLGLWAPVLGTGYIVLLRKKSAKICKAGALVHLLVAVLVIITSVMNCVSMFVADSQSVSVMSENLTGMMTSLPIEDIINSEGNQNIASLLFNVIKAFTVINVLLSAFLSLIPVWLSVKATGYCEMHDELKEKNGYPFFHPDIALQSMTEEIENQKTHRLQTDTKMAVTNAQLMDRLREQKVDFKDTDALIAGIIENSGSEQKDSRSSANVVDMVDSMFDSARKSASGSSKSRFATSDMNSVSGIFGKLTQISGTKKETENSLAMKALVKEAERLRQKKQFQSQNDDRRF